MDNKVSAKDEAKARAEAARLHDALVMYKRAAREQAQEEHIPAVVCACGDHCQAPGSLCATCAKELEASRDRLRELLSKAIDVLVLPGHAFCEADWKEACLLSGRWCAPYLDLHYTQDD